MKIKEDVHFLANAGIVTTNLQNIEIKEDSIIYTYIMNNGIETVVGIKENSNGDMSYHFSENEKENDLVITTDGKLYLDGNEVIVESYENEKLEMQPRSTSYNTTTCPRGSSSDYTEYYYTEKNANIQLGVMLQNIATGVLAAILANLAGPIGAPYAGISYAIAAGILSDFSVSDPNSTALSSQAKIYNHKDGPYMGSIYRKLNNKWYSKVNYKGAIKNTISYRVTEYY